MNKIFNKVEHYFLETFDFSYFIIIILLKTITELNRLTKPLISIDNTYIQYQAVLFDCLILYIYIIYVRGEFKKYAEFFKYMKTY